MSGRGILFVMTGASGVGKDTIRQASLPAVGGLHYSVSATTRERRVGEVHGEHYWFLDKATFKGMADRGEFLEHAEYVGDYYGTPTRAVRDALNCGRDVLLELEVSGARQVKKRRPDAIMVFIAPPTLCELERRLRGRGTDAEEKIQKRLARAREELRAVREFDYVVVNDTISTAVKDFIAIIRAERTRAHRVTEQEVDLFLREVRA